MRLGIAQIDTVPGDLARTTERVVTCSRIAAERGAELVVFPLTTLAGPSALPPGVQDAFVDHAWAALEGIAEEVACDCAIPIVVLVDDVPTVEVIVLMGGEVRALRSLGSGAGADGAESVDLASYLPVLPHGESHVLFAFSYEELDCLGGPDDHGGYDVVVFVSGYSYAVNDASSVLGAALAQGRFRHDARACGAWLVGVGAVGGFGGQVFTGSSFVLSPDGSLVACGVAFEEEVVVAEVGSDAAVLGSASLQLEPYDEPYHLWQALTLGLSDYVRAVGAETVALVYDGSLASRALACLASDSLGPMRVRLYVCPGGSEMSLEAARLGASLRVRVVGARDGAAPTDGALTAETLLVAQLLEDSRDGSVLMLSTRDKTSWALEAPSPWDRVATFAPLGDVYRSDVYAMLQMRNLIAPVMERVMVGSRDLPTLVAGGEGASESFLEELDTILERHLEGETSFAAQMDEAADDEARGLIRAVAATYATTARTRQMPACLIASTCTLAEASLPLGFSWTDEGRPSGIRPSASSTKTERTAGFGLPGVIAEGVGSTVPNGGALREALDLLRDISVGSGVDWRNPFSEN